MNDEIIQHYNCWRAFNNKVYKHTLTAEYLVNNGAEKYIDSVFHVTKDAEGNYEVKEGKGVKKKCVFLDKGGIKYILPTDFQDKLPINVKNFFEVYLKKSDKTIYRFITQVSSVRISPEKTLSLKELCQVFNPLQHTNDKVWTFLKLQAIGSKAKGGKYRLCSKPACGKNANDTIIHSITNDNVRVSKPTIAKIETLFYYNQKVLIDEMTSLTTTQIKEIEPFILNFADESPTFEKHSMARRKDMNEVDITQASGIFTYNDRGSLQVGAKFFDDVWQNIDAINSRYPAFYLDGEVVSELPKLSMTEAKKIMEENYDKLRVIAKNLVYYFMNMSKELHRYDRSKLKLYGRHKVNSEAILDACDVWSETESEFLEWIDFINDSVQKYKEKNLDKEATIFEEFVGDKE